VILTGGDDLLVTRFLMAGDHDKKVLTALLEHNKAEIKKWIMYY